MRTAREYLHDLTGMGCNHPPDCCCDRCKHGRETFLLESDIRQRDAEVMREAAKIAGSVVVENKVEPWLGLRDFKVRKNCIDLILAAADRMEKGEV